MRNRNARHGNHTVGEFEEYVNGVHRANLGCNSVRGAASRAGTWSNRARAERGRKRARARSRPAQGWDRYLDFHMGVWCSRPEYLDRIGPKLCETGVGFHTHRGSGDIGAPSTFAYSGRHFFVIALRRLEGECTEWRCPC